MHAFLIAGGNAQKRQGWIDNKLTQWKIGPFDTRVLRPQEASIGISHVRQFQRSLITGPSAAIIWQAERLTPEAQNALLKTLEEPPRSTKIILETQTLDTLLPTVISRCLVTTLGVSDSYSQGERNAWLAAWSTLVSERPGVALGAASAIATGKEEAQAWVTCGIEALRRSFDIQSAQAIERLLKAQVQLAANVTPKLVIDLCILG